MMEILFRRPELDDRETILKHLSERDSEAAREHLQMFTVGTFLQ